MLMRAVRFSDDLAANFETTALVECDGMLTGPIEVGLRAAARRGDEQEAPGR
jgi:hypothetical protein